jgi:3-hydroxybutyryl-CoA dehydratase
MTTQSTMTQSTPGGMPASMHFEDLALGDEAEDIRQVAATDVTQFAAISGDHNPLHFDTAYASQTLFKGCITHGMLTASYISAVFGMRLPGPGAIYISQTLNFKGPVRVGDHVTTVVRVVDLLPAKRRVRFSCECRVGGKLVLCGEAILMVPSRP